MKIEKQFDLTYCSNIFAGNTWSKVFKNLKTHIPILKSKLSPNMPFGIGLRLSKQSAKELLDNLDAFKSWLTQTNCYVATINGFVYGNFHNKPVKEKVYEPDWSTRKRLNFNVHLIDIAAELCTINGELGFSTSPLSYKFWSEKKDDEKFFAKVCSHLLLLIKKSLKIFQDTTKIIHIDFEPEADCLLETMEDTVTFFKKIIFGQVAHSLSNDFQMTLSEAVNHIRRHVRICYDICHQSVQFEDHIKNFEILEKVGIRIGKVQISSALRFKAGNAIDLFKDNIYLHQTVVKDSQGVLKKFRDLDQAKGETEDEFRVHFHLPVFVDKYDNFLTTNNDIVNVLNFLKNHQITSCLEIETYTWQVLPQNLQIDLISSIQKEYEWVIEKLCKKL
ncbi:EboE, Xylose isomerase-like superfamily [Candidatus Phycorickettsia trachydisci]|uniref:EboE, Xylose isomerase-like superfamily n=1 Tax=Candidatus Phycorickettsia trachydisci TaxID=2115978 RepID=A0A2P1PA13_9RICK|nr:metabolite traffic protein EboE [Candidatus Phycorickettsia trachydisci]AVP88085.1 EboE, Xylose isomerase-like superfamily [Candidatus Phycorickettsia trachydisci]